MAVTELLDTDPVRVGDVLIVGRLGEGGMGVVYLGRGPAGSAVAVKVMRADLAASNDFRRRFAEEVAAMRSVGAAHAAGVIESDISAIVPWVTMEYVQGLTLGERISRAGPLPPDELRPFALGLLRAVAGVHAAGVVHRDLKPSNVVLSPQGVRLLDFGVAKSPGARTSERERVGSLTWMAPEQLAGDPIGTACDVHAVGMVLYYAATGRHVFGYGEAKAVAWRISHVVPQLVDLPEEVTAYGDLILAALAKDPARRPPLRAMHERLRVRDVQVAVPQSSHTSIDTNAHEQVDNWSQLPGSPRPPGQAVASPRVEAPGPVPEPQPAVDLMSLVEVVAQGSGGHSPRASPRASAWDSARQVPQRRPRLQQRRSAKSGPPILWSVAVVLAVLVAIAWMVGVWPFGG